VDFVGLHYIVILQCTVQGHKKKSSFSSVRTDECGVGKKDFYEK